MAHVSSRERMALSVLTSSKTTRVMMSRKSQQPNEDSLKVTSKRRGNCKRRYLNPLERNLPLRCHTCRLWIASTLTEKKATKMKMKKQSTRMMTTPPTSTRRNTVAKKRSKKRNRRTDLTASLKKPPVGHGPLYRILVGFVQ